nr:phosphopantetheine-binding protein [Enterovibrio nigricans]
MKNKVFPDSHIIDDLGLDSLDIIDFLLELEAEFNLQFDFEKIDFSIMQSMNALIAFIKAEQERCTVE